MLFEPDSPRDFVNSTLLNHTTPCQTRFLTTYPIGGTTLCEAAGCWSRHIVLKDHGSAFYTYRIPSTGIREYSMSLIVDHDRGQQEAASKTELPAYDPSVRVNQA